MSESKSKAAKLSPSRLRDAYALDLTEAWAHFRKTHPDHTPYAFALYGVEDPIRLAPVVLTEESLTQVAKRYLDQGYFDTLEESRKELRYSVDDSPLSQELYDHVPTADAITSPHERELSESEYALLAKAGTDALKSLDRKGLFGKGKARQRLLLAIITFDTEEDYFTPSARALNPPAVFKRFQDQTKVEGVYASCDVIAIAPDGKRIYTAGSRDNPDRKSADDDEFIEELVAGEIRGLRVRRRWVFTFPMFGDSIRDIVLPPDGKSIIACRQKQSGNKGETFLQRFGLNSNKLLQETQVPGGPVTCALSHDGARLAVTMYDKTIHLLDARTFEPLATRKLTAGAYGLHFLRAGKKGMLLAATEKEILRLDPGTLKPVGRPIPIPAYRFVTDDAEKLVAVSRWFPFSVRVTKKKELGVRLLRLPNFKPVREFQVPGSQCVTVAISGDGKRIAFEAHQIDTPRKFVVVFDTQTGEELARRKSDFIHDLAFLPDGRTLAIGGSRDTTGEAVELWQFDRGA